MPDKGTPAVNVYAIVQRHGVVLIDSGLATAEAWNALSDGLAKLGFGLEQVLLVLVTHLHYDHVSQAVRLRERFGVPFVMGVEEQENVHEAVRRPGLIQPAFAERLIAAGAGHLIAQLGDGGTAAASDLIAQPDEWLVDGQAVALQDRTLHVIATPGHTRGHIAFVDSEAGLLFAGDHLLPEVTTPVGFEPIPSATPLIDFERSLHRVLGIRDARLLPAHGPVMPSAHERVLSLLEHTDRRRARVLAAVADGPASAAEIAERMPWTRQAMHLRELGRVVQLTAVNEILAVLETQTSRGEIERTSWQGTWQFRRSA